MIGCEANVGEQSDLTAIIARNIVVTSGVELVLNSDYSNLNVPLPQSGDFGTSAVRLSR